MIVAASIGSTYAAVLWLAARYIARSRDMTLGAWPATAIVVCGAAAAFVEGRYPLAVAALVSATLIGTIVCAVVDARTGYIFDVLTLMMLCATAFLSLAAGRLADGALGATAVGGAMYALFLGTGRRGLGLGDVKLAAVLAFGLGLRLGMFALGCAFIIGAMYSVALLTLRHAQRTDAVRFGPFLAGGAVLTVAAEQLGFGW